MAVISRTAGLTPRYLLFGWRAISIHRIEQREAQQSRQEAADMRLPGNRRGDANDQSPTETEEKVHREPDEDEGNCPAVPESRAKWLGRDVEGGRRAPTGERPARREGEAGGRRHHAGYRPRGSYDERLIGDMDDIVQTRSGSRRNKAQHQKPRGSEAAASQSEGGGP